MNTHAPSRGLAFSSGVFTSVLYITMERQNTNPYIVCDHSHNSVPAPSSDFGTALATSAYIAEMPDDNITPSHMPIGKLAILLLLRDMGGDSVGTTTAFYKWMVDMGLDDLHTLVFVDHEMLHVLEPPASEILMRACGVDTASGTPNYYKYTLHLLNNLTNDKTHESATNRYLREYGINMYRHVEVLHCVVGELNVRNTEKYNWRLPQWDSLARTPLIVLEDFCAGRYR